MNKEEILAKLAAGELKVDEASKLLAELDQAKRGSLYCKVSEKGAISVYGLQRMPVTLYVEQWDRLLNFSDDLRALHERERREAEAQRALIAARRPRQSSHPPASGVQPRAYAARNTHQMQTPHATSKPRPASIIRRAGIRPEP